MLFPDRIFAAILGAVRPEVQYLTDALENRQSVEMVGERFALGNLHGKILLVGTTGIGKVNAAITTAALLTRFTIEQVWNVGWSGYFQEGPLEIGDVLIAETLICGDEGVLTSDAVRPSRDIGIPILETEEGTFFDVLPPSIAVHQLRQQIAPGLYRSRAGGGITAAAMEDGKRCPAEGVFRLAYGPSLTVGMVSGDLQVARARFLNHGALTENMEGSAIAQTCCRFKIPFIECRGVSNKAGDRDKANWELKKAISHCHAVVMHYFMNQQN
ncbi:hypothetical protein [Desulfoferrobacter suflitae]|uniref:phosphorylase family protein n=1 Tax=Desulfoferrobacter suflitae TaxID=2865782 RepID=UPI002164EB57|nr:hypothetical protein [Desulfoferrobacter suflitae]MCK8600689.1 hypothetical protein [Desulfoferrobacter suflitae]